MTKKELKEYNVLKLEIEQLEEKVFFWKERKTSIKSQMITDMPQGGGGHAGLLNIIVKIESVIEKYEKKIIDLIVKTYDIEETIEDLNVAERVLMRYRYMDNLKMFQIADRMNFSERTVNKIHSEALKKIA